MQREGRVSLARASFPGNSLIPVLERAEEHAPSQLGELLKRCRTRIGHERASLGPYLRLPVRIGKVITQEEVAEAVGISRQWYGLLESNHRVRVSSAVLTRVADALMMDVTERATLFRLALPELRSSLTDTSAALLDALGSLHGFMRRLWAASTETEALTLVREYAMTELAPDVMATCTRVAEGRWEDATTGDDGERVKRLHGLIGDHGGLVAVDDLHCFPLLSSPGELVTLLERDAYADQVGLGLRQALDAVDWSGSSSAMALVRSPSGFVAQVQAIHHSSHAFSEIERAQLSTLAELTSLALSGCV
jgi:transcriptional regulator with XRE-family HTH domain